MTGRRFHVRVRPKDASSCSNLFARLSPEIAQSLYSEAVAQGRELVHDDNGWTASTSCGLSSSCESGVEFLPLAITLASSEVIYVSYNGGSIVEQDTSMPTIELPSSVLPENGNTFEYVTVKPLGHVENATAIYMEPLECSDWELLETHADFLEGGGLLRQVSLVCPHQVLPLWVGGRDVVSVRVLPRNFCTEDDDSLSWSETSDDDASQEDSRSCLRLVADTEVIVTPKPRSSSTSNFQMSEALRVHPTLEDWSLPMKNLLEAPIPPLSVPPRTLMVHPYTLDKCVPGWKEAKQTNEESVLAVVWKSRQENDIGEERLLQDGNDKVEETVVRVVASENVPYDHAALHRYVRYHIGVTPLCDHVHIRILTQDHVQAGPECFRESVQEKRVNVFLEAVSFEENETSTKPWQRPYETNLHIIFAMQNQPSGGMSRLTELRSILASWADLPDAYKELPLSPGSLISLPWAEPGNLASEATLYRFVSRGDASSAQDPLFISAKDLPSLLLQSKSIKDGRLLHESGVTNQSLPDIFDRGTANVNILALPPHESLLNLLPPTPNLSSNKEHESSNEIDDQSLVDGIGSFDSIVITGETGSGKTHAAFVLAARARLAKACATVYLDCKKLQSSSGVRMNDILSQLTESFRTANKMRPCLVVLDDVDEVAPNMQAESGDEESSIHHQQVNPVAVDQAKLISDHIENLIRESRLFSDKKAGSFIGVCIVFTCRDDTSISPSLLSCQVCPRVVAVPDFGGNDRKMMFLCMLQCVLEQPQSSANRHDHTSGIMELPYPGFAKKTEGFRPRDLEVVAKRVQHILYISLQRNVEVLDVTHPPEVEICLPSNLTSAVDEALADFTPISRQSMGAEDTASSAGWSEVGGLFSCKEQLSAAILHPVKYSAIYKRAPIKLPRGILLYGPPGCGKSFLVPALAAECDFNLITCRGPELLDKYIGASEAKVRQLFARAYSAAPSLLFLDEFDALAPRRGSDHTGVTDRVVNQLLTFLDGVEDAIGSKAVYILAATSRPDKVDPALLRPGRLERHVFIGYPQSEQEWNHLFGKIITSRDNVSAEVRELVTTGQLLNRVKDCSPQLRYFAAADLKAVMDSAHLEAVHEYLRFDNRNENEQTVEISLEHLLKALQSTRPSLPPDDRRMLSRAYAPFKKDGDSNVGLVSTIGGYDGDYASGTPSLSGDTLDDYLPGRGPLKTALK